MTLKEEIRDLKQLERAELDKVRKKYRKLFEETRSDCEHDWSEWYMTPNPDYRYDLNYNIIYLRDCKLCSKSETRHGE